MDEQTLEKLGLNKNEAKVYLALLLKGEASASELVKAVGVHRNIVYDNIEKLMEKGLVSYVTDGKKRFIAQEPNAIIEFLETKKDSINKEMELAKSIIPDIKKIVGSQKSMQESFVFRGAQGLKKVLAEIVQAKESWCIGITNESVRILGDTYWKNYNQKKKATKTKEWLLWNSDYKDSSIGNNPRSFHKMLPKDLDQVTETIMWNDKTAIFVYSSQPIVIVMENKEIFNMYKAHFDFLWKISKDNKSK